jgi:hypothetical protein
LAAVAPLRVVLAQAASRTTVPRRRARQRSDMTDLHGELLPVTPAIEDRPIAGTDCGRR